MINPEPTAPSIWTTPELQKGSIPDATAFDVSGGFDGITSSLS